MEPTDAYLSFMLRMWQDAEGLPWHASLEHPQTGEQMLFATVDELFTYLDRLMDDQQCREGVSAGSGGH